MRQQKLAVFDIDGTLFRSSLLIELTEELIQKGVFPAYVRKLYQQAYYAWIERSGSYNDYIGAVVIAFRKHLKGVRYSDFLQVADQVALVNQHRVYRYTRDLIRNLKKKRYYLLAISNSPKTILDIFCREYGFDKVYGRLYHSDDMERFSGEVLFEDLIEDKARILERAVAKENLTLSGSIGVGDSEGDISFLKMVNRPICFNPNKKLYQHAKRVGWEIVIERKDMIYKI